MDYSRGFFWMFFSVFFYVFRFFYTSKVFLFRSLDMLTRVHGFRFFIARCSFVPRGVGFVGVCETTRPSFLVKVLFG